MIIGMSMRTAIYQIWLEFHKIYIFERNSFERGTNPGEIDKDSDDITSRSYTA